LDFIVSFSKWSQSMGEFTDDALPLPVRVARTAEKAPDMEDEAAGFGISKEVHNDLSLNEAEMN
jgi:hypothetical protein